MSTDVAVSDFESAQDGLGELFYPLYRRLFDDDGDFVADVERKLVEAKFPYTVEFYLSQALAIGVLLGLVLWIAGLGLGTVLVQQFVTAPPTFIGLSLPPAVLSVVEPLKIPFLVAVTGLFFGAIGFAMGFGTLVGYPYVRANAREREINFLLADAVSFMYALSVGGLNQLEILRAVAEAEDTYGEVAREFQSIVLETEYFDTDYRTAIRQQAEETPSDELSQFLTDLLSILNSGGDMESFLDDKKDRYMRTAKQEQEDVLEMLELFGEMYMTLSLFPLLLVIVLVVMSMLGKAPTVLLYATVYALIPLTGFGFLVLVSTVKVDQRTDGYLVPDEGDRTVANDDGFFGRGLVEQYVGEYGIFDRIARREGTHRTMELLRRPHHLFRAHPLYTLFLTVPAALAFVLVAVATGAVPVTWPGVISAPVLSTVLYVYVPLFVTLVPLAAFHEWNVRSRRAVLRTLSEDLRKLASTNETGLTLLESIKVVADTSTGTLADELATMYAKVRYGVSLKESLYRFNNRYHIPRLARTVKLVSKAQEASSEISSVLSTAAQASENQDDLERERKSRTRMQVVIVLMTYLTLLGVMAVLKTQFVDVMARLGSQASGANGAMSGMGSVDTELLSLLFFHAVTIQAVISGLISGYVRNARLLSGVKYIVALLSVALVVWMVVG